MNKNKKINYIIITSLIAALFLYIIEQHLLVNYAIKTSAKILLFVCIPIVYGKLAHEKSYINNLRLKRDSNIKIGVILGFLAFIIVIVAYMIFKSSIDFSSIINQMKNQSKITPANFIFVGLYVTFINSFLEEYFFRGFIFLNIYSMGKKKLAYGYSSLLFALYHIGIFRTWFNPLITLLAMFGLVTIGLIFNYVDVKSKNLLNSWLIHILADTAIIIIGLKLFEFF